MEDFFLHKYVAITGLVLNLIGTLLLSVPTVGGASFLGKSFGFLSKIFSFVAGLLIGIAILSIVLFLFAWFFDLELLLLGYLGQLPDSTDMSFWETAKALFWAEVNLIKNIMYFAAISAVLALIPYTFASIFTWVQAEKELIKQKERKIGILGLALMFIGFSMQLLQTIYNH